MRRNTDDVLQSRTTGNWFQNPDSKGLGQACYICMNDLGRLQKVCYRAQLMWIGGIAFLDDEISYLLPAGQMFLREILIRESDGPAAALE